MESIAYIKGIIKTKRMENKNPGKIWKENELVAEELAYCYYQSILDEYKKEIKKSSKKDFGFNVFIDGIRVGLDIIVPLLNEDAKKIVEEKIKSMIEHRKKIEREAGEILEVECSFCKRKIECPKEMLNMKKHACFDCFKRFGDQINPEEIAAKKIHIDIPMDRWGEFMEEVLAETLRKNLFEEMWKEEKTSLKEMPKRELAEEMFMVGVDSAINLIMGGKVNADNEENGDKSK